MPQAAVLLLFVAAGLLLLAGVATGRLRGARPRSRDLAVMAGMTGVATAFLFIAMPVAPLIIFPMVIAGVLLASWLADRRVLQLGAFLVGAGGYIVTAEALGRANDLADPAVTTPGWTPVPLAIAVVALVLGSALVAGALRTRS
jgi:hypothetical protein